jgi:ketosteroid isomerase-like protein
VAEGFEAAVRGYYTAIDAGDIASAMTVFHPDAVYERPGTPRLEGRTAIERFYLDVRPTGGHHHIEAVAIAADRAVVEGRFRAPDGPTFRFADSFVFDGDDRVVSRATYALG